jgi:hypothetical protein
MTPLQYCGMRHIPCRKGAPFPAVPEHHPWVPQNLRPELAVPFFDYFLTYAAPPQAVLFGAQADAVTEIARRGAWVAYARKASPPAPAPAK